MWSNRNVSIEIISTLRGGRSSNVVNVEVSSVDVLLSGSSAGGFVQARSGSNTTDSGPHHSRPGDPSRGNPTPNRIVGEDPASDESPTFTSPRTSGPSAPRARRGQPAALASPSP